MSILLSTKEIIQKTSQLVAIPSTVDNNLALHQAVNFVADFVAQHAPNITIERFEKNGIPSFIAYKGSHRPATFDILLNAHVDVVPAGPEQFIAYENDGKLFGRGTLDMKGTAVVLASVFVELVDEVPYVLGLQIVSDEENGGDNGVLHHINEGVRANFAVMGEYSNHKATIYNAARGLCWVEVAFGGKTAHGGHPWKGDNAIVRASNFITSVLQRYPIPTEETWTTTATIASISTPNTTYNQIPDYAAVKIDFRFTSQDPAFQNEAAVRDLVAGIDPDAKLLAISSFGPSVYVEKTNHYVQGLHTAVSSVSGIEPTYHFRPASSDGRHFSAVGIPCVEFGLYGHNSHAANEYVEIDSIDEYANTLRAFLKNPKI